VSKKDQQLVGLLIVGGAALYCLYKLANNPRLNPNLRSIAHTAEDDLIEDMTSEFVSLI